MRSNICEKRRRTRTRNMSKLCSLEQLKVRGWEARVQKPFRLQKKSCYLHRKWIDETCCTGHGMEDAEWYDDMMEKCRPWFDLLLLVLYEQNLALALCYSWPGDFQVIWRNSWRLANRPKDLPNQIFKIYYLNKIIKILNILNLFILNNQIIQLFFFFLNNINIDIYIYNFN